MSSKTDGDHIFKWYYHAESAKTMVFVTKYFNIQLMLKTIFYRLQQSLKNGTVSFYDKSPCRLLPFSKQNIKSFSKRR